VCLCRGHVCRADDGQWGRRLRAGVEPASGLDECVRPLSGVCGCGPWRVQDSASLGGRSTCMLFRCGGKGGERGSESEKSSGCVLDNCSVRCSPFIVTVIVFYSMYQSLLHATSQPSCGGRRFDSAGGGGVSEG
jgi:hypothetical protein